MEFRRFGWLEPATEESEFLTAESNGRRMGMGTREWESISATGRFVWERKWIAFGWKIVDLSDTRPYCLDW